MRSVEVRRCPLQSAGPCCNLAKRTARMSAKNTEVDEKKEDEDEEAESIHKI